MSNSSDVLTLGLFLTLLFGSICLYLYTRVQQTEQKLELIESILLEMKMTSEFKTLPIQELPSVPSQSCDTPSTQPVSTTSVLTQDTPTVTEEVKIISETCTEKGELRPFVDSSLDLEPVVEQPLKQLSMEESLLDSFESSLNNNKEKSELLFSGTPVNTNYEAMTIKELKELAEQRGLNRVSQMRKPQLLEAIRNSDVSSLVNLTPFSTESLTQ